METFNPDQIRSFLKKYSFFDLFNDEELDFLSHYGKLFKRDEGVVIAREGDIDTSFYVILLGSCAVLKQNSCLTILNPGDVFGEMGVISGQPRSADVETREPSLFLRIEGSILEKTNLKFQLKFYKKMTRILIDRLAQTNKLNVFLAGRGKPRRS